MWLSPEVDSAIEDIANEAIVSDTNDTPAVIDLSNLISQNGPAIIREEFSYPASPDFNNKSHEMFRRWFIDADSTTIKLISTTQSGLTDIRNIDVSKSNW